MTKRIASCYLHKSSHCTSWLQVPCDIMLSQRNSNRCKHVFSFLVMEEMCIPADPQGAAFAVRAPTKVDNEGPEVAQKRNKNWPQPLHT